MLNMEMLTEKEIELAGFEFESTLANLINMDNIETFMEAADESSTLSKKEKVKEFFNKIIQAVKDFFKKIKDTIDKKIKEKKVLEAINKIKREGIKMNKKLKIDGMLNEKEIMKICNEQIKKVAECTKKVMSAKTTEEIDKLALDLSDDLNLIQDKVQIAVINGDITLDQTMQVFKSNKALKIEDMTTNVMNKMMTIADERYVKLKKLEKDSASTNAIASEQKLEEARVSALKRISISVSSFFKKVGTLLSSSKAKAIMAICGVAAAVGAGSYKNEKKKKMQQKIQKRYNEQIHESVDDAIDDMMSEIMLL